MKDPFMMQLLTKNEKLYARQGAQVARRQPAPPKPPKHCCHYDQVPVEGEFNEDGSQKTKIVRCFGARAKQAPSGFLCWEHSNKITAFRSEPPIPYEDLVKAQMTRDLASGGLDLRIKRSRKLYNEVYLDSELADLDREFRELVESMKEFMDLDDHDHGGF